MTPSDDPRDDAPDDERAAQEDVVRRLLADARHDEPIPEDVIARLDRVLAGLATDPAPAVVVDLADHRRRKVLVGLVAAAAVLVVAGVGVRQAVSDAGSSDSATSADSAPDAGGSADRGSAAATKGNVAGSAVSAQPSAASGAVAGAGGDDVGNSVRTSLDPATGLPLLTSTRFVAQVQQLVASRNAAHGDSTTNTGAADGDAQFNAPAPDASPTPASSPGPLLSQAGSAHPGLPAGCLATGLGSGLLLPVIYDGAPAILALRPPTSQSQVVDLLACGGTTLRSVTLPR